MQGSIDLAYPQVPPFPHVEDYLWPDFSDDADAFFEQFKGSEELDSYRSQSPCLPPVPRFDTPVDQRRIEFFQGWEFQEGDVRYAPPPLEPALPPQIWQEPLPISPCFPPADHEDPGYHVPDLEQVHQDFRNYNPEPIHSPSPLEEPVDWTYVRHRLLEQEIFRSGFSLPSLQVSSGSLTIHIEHSSQTRSRTLFERELTWALSSKEIDAIARIHGRETF